MSTRSRRGIVEKRLVKDGKHVQKGDRVMAPYGGHSYPAWVEGFPDNPG